ncbi:MAG: alpha/beta fold hydrolase [SAR202 cluster bacterium]|nr:alpha/beta fold hydrolase [SAR202 cluster bacterium]
MATTALTEQSTSKFVQAGDIKLHYNEAGSGDAVIMLHGGGPGASGWSNFSTNIGPFAEHYRTMLFDMPQFGKSDPVVINEERAHYNAKAIKKGLDQLGIKKVSFIGNSFGGATSLAFVLLYPEAVHKLVLMGAAGYGQSIFGPTPLEGIKALNAWWHVRTKEAMKEIVDIFVYDQKFKTDELVGRRFNAAMSKPEHIEARNKSTGGLMDYTPELHKIKAPTLVIWGRDDRFSPLDWALRLTWHLPNAQLHVFPQCGHWVQYEKSDQFNRLVLDFLQNG